MKRFFLYTILFISIFIITGCDFDNTTYKSNGLKITLPKGLKKSDFDGMTLYMEKDDMYVSGSFISYDDLMKLDITKDSNIENYIDNIISNNEISTTIKKSKTNNSNSFYYGTYDDTEYEYYNIISFFKTDKGYWIVTLSCPKNYKYDYKNRFLDYIKTIEFY